MAGKILLYVLLASLTATALAVVAFLYVPGFAVMSGGLTLPEARPMGYDAADITAWRAALGPEGLAKYATFQRSVDAVTALLLAATLALPLYQLARRRAETLLWSLAPAYLVTDWWENAMLLRLTDPQLGQVPATLAARAGTATSVKFLLLALCFAVLLALWRGRKRRLTRH
jgi:hypothetical protein